MRQSTRIPRIRAAALILFPSLLIVFGGGCNVIGAAAQILPAPDIAPVYKGFSGQTVALMVWCDRGIRIDYPTVQGDIARSIVTKLNLTAHPKGKDKDKEKVPDEMKNVKFRDPMEIIRFQEDHPELEGQPSSDLATRLGVTRVIYLEVYDFETRSELSVDLFKGTVLSRMEVFEITTGPDGRKAAKLAYKNPDLRSNYPPNRPEGVAGDDVSQDYIYRKTVEQYSTDIALMFVQHSADDEPHVVGSGN